jgi:predicted PurR-regulated permease PerM
MAFVRGEERVERLRFLGLEVLVIVGVLMAVSVALILLFEVRRVIVWLLISVFFAAVLSPLVSFVERRGIRRGVAVAVVTIGLTLLVGGILFAFGKPVVTQAGQFADQLPQTLDRIRNAPLVRDVADRFNIQASLDNVGSDVPKQLVGLSGPIFGAFASIGRALIGLVTIIVFTIFLLLYGPGFARTAHETLPAGEPRRAATRVAERSMHAVSGWVAGNVLTSLIASFASLFAFLIMGLPYAFLLALWVGIADLIPLVGATLGALPAIVVAFLHSVPTGIITIVFFVIYQQFENHVLQPVVYGRTIRLNPFLVLLAVIIGVELAGFIGALLALPVAGVIQVMIEELAPGLARAAFPTRVEGEVPESSPESSED